MAYERYPSSWKAKEASEIVFSEKEVPTAQNNYSLCKVRIQIFNLIRKSLNKRLFLVYDIHISFSLQNVSFTDPFYTPPVIITTVLNGGSNNANIACPVKGPLSSWLEVNYNQLVP